MDSGSAGRGAAPEGVASHETWLDFLRDTGTRQAAADDDNGFGARGWTPHEHEQTAMLPPPPPFDISNRPRPSVPGALLSPSEPNLLSTIARPSVFQRPVQRAVERERERKRRLTDTAPSGREGGSHFANVFNSSSAFASGPAAGPAFIDLTTSPNRQQARTSTSWRGIEGPSGHRRSLSSLLSQPGEVGIMDVAPRNTATFENMQQNAEGMSPNDIVLPIWQPDSEATSCPVCGNAFGFFYRKHHCRKCGRVVCANCSPHRITIPRQFIVHPPEDAGIVKALDYNPDRADTYTNPALGGGAEVRVCNPCVPDPNMSAPPQQDQPPPYQPSDLRNYMRHDLLWQAPPDAQDAGQAPPQGLYDIAGGPQRRWRPRSRHAQQASGDIFRDRRVSFTNPSSVSDLYPPPFASGAMTHPLTTGASSVPPHGPGPFNEPAFHNSPFSYSRPSAFHYPHHSTGNIGTGASAAPSRRSFDGHRDRSVFDPRLRHPPVSAPPPAIPPRRIRRVPPSQQHQPRPQLDEEDECPVCGNELPPKGPNGETDAREQHVVECIASYSGQPVPSSSRPISDSTSGPVASSGSLTIPLHPLAGASASSAPSAASSSMIPDAGGSATGEPSAAADAQLPRRRLTGNRMLVTPATEKDCVGEDGEQAECIICFEEFEPGVELARLECLCKFHRRCIRQWWDTKGSGSCPTHQLSD